MVVAKLTQKIHPIRQTISVYRYLKTAVGCCFIYILAITATALADTPQKVLTLREQYSQFATSGSDNIINGKKIFVDKEKPIAKVATKSIMKEGQLALTYPLLVIHTTKSTSLTHFLSHRPISHQDIVQQLL